MDLKVRPSALGSYSKEKGIQFGAEHLIRFSTKLSLSLNHGAKVRIFSFPPNLCLKITVQILSSLSGPY